MSKQPPVAVRDSEQLPQDIQELAAAVAQLTPEQRTRIEPILCRVAESTRRRRRIWRWFRRRSDSCVWT